MLQERERVTRLGELTQDDDSHVRIARVQFVRGADPLVGARRWHADVGHQNVGMFGVDGFEQRGVVRARRDQLEVVLGGDQSRDTFANEVIVLGQDDADRHGNRLRDVFLGVVTNAAASISRA